MPTGFPLTPFATTLARRLRRPRVIVRTVVATALLLSSSGCSSSESPEPPEPAGIKELTTPESETSSASKAPPVQLLRDARRHFQNGMYTLAREPLQALSTPATNGAYRTFAQIKLADTYFFNGEHAQAAKLYEEFATNSPSSPELPYALIQAARAYTSIARGAGRDRKPLERALQIYDTIATQNSTNQFGRTAIRERRPILEQLAAYDQGIIDFYRSVGNTAAVEARQQAFDAQWGARLKAE